MSEASGTGSGERPPRINTPGGIFVRDLAEGCKLRLSDGGIVEIVMNANDGGWVFARYLEHANEPELVGTEDWVFFGDVVEEVQ